VIELIQNKKHLIYYKKKFLKKVKNLANKNVRKRARVCIHTSQKDKTHEMIIVLKRGSYIQPHIHPNSKSESYHVLEGKMDVYVFSKSGKKLKTIKMGDYKSNLNFYYRMGKKNFYHMPIATSNFCVYHEVFSGPFNKKSDVKYSKWSPKESEKKLVNSFLKRIGYL